MPWPSLVPFTFSIKARSLIESEAAVKTSSCTSCGGSKKSQFINKKEGGKVDIYSLIGKIPRPKDEQLGK